MASYNFAIIGLGYIARRHLQAIKDLGHELVAALDPHDSVGILDEFFPDCIFFTEEKKFELFLLDQQRQNTTKKIDYITICSPNYLHRSHIEIALRASANVICEKPLVLIPEDLSSLSEIAMRSGHRIATILQLRYHPQIIQLKMQQDQNPVHRNISLRYITSRGNWYHASWKSDDYKSGGILTNIGIHFFDMLLWIYGRVLKLELHALNDYYAIGTLELETATVEWFLSIDRNHLPDNLDKTIMNTYRSLQIGEEEFEFSDGFKNLHKEVYQNIINGNAYGISDARPSIELVHQLRQAPITNPKFF